MRLAFDIKLMKPACVLVAAGMGADTYLASKFNTRDWLLAPTPDMKVYEINDDQLAQLVNKVNNHTR